MSINYSGYPYYSEEEVRNLETVAYQRGYKVGYQQALMDTQRDRKKPLKVKVWCVRG